MESLNLNATEKQISYDLQWGLRAPEAAALRVSPM
jgi:hypothetical protein